MQEPMGEHMAALRVGAELDLVDREEFDPAVERHRLDRADEILRMGGDDLLLAGDERDARRPARLDHSVVDLARQQPQRQADHARGMGQHALDREMGLAGVGRTEDGDQTRARRVVHGANVEDRGAASFVNVHAARCVSAPRVAQGRTCSRRRDGATVQDQRFGGNEGKEQADALSARSKGRTSSSSIRASSRCSPAMCGSSGCGPARAGARARPGSPAGRYLVWSDIPNNRMLR